MEGNVFFLLRQEEINTQEEKKIPAKPWKKAMTKTRVINNLTGVVSKLTLEKRDSLDIQRNKNVSSSHKANRFMGVVQSKRHYIS